MKIKIIKMGINGEGIGYWKNKPVFVAGALVSEEVEVTDIVEQQRYISAKLKKIVKPSQERIIPKCPVQKRCGACPLMVLSYKNQLIEKENLLQQALYKYARIKKELIKPIVASPEQLGYRNFLKLPVKKLNDKLVTGLYEPESNYFVEFDTCLIHKPQLETVRKKILTIFS